MRAAKLLIILVIEASNIFAFEDDLAFSNLAVAGKQTKNRHCGGGLTGAGLTHDCNRLAWVDGHVDAADCFDDTGGGSEGDLDALHLQQWLFSVMFSHDYRFLAFGSSASRTTSPIMIKLNTVSARAPAG